MINLLVQHFRLFIATNQILFAPVKFTLLRRPIRNKPSIHIGLGKCTTLVILFFRNYICVVLDLHLLIELPLEPYMKLLMCVQKGTAILSAGFMKKPS